MAEITPREAQFDRCYCTRVTRAQVVAVIQAHGCRTVDELRERTGVCGGCGSCRPEVIALLASCQPPSPPAAPPDTHPGTC